MCRHSPADSPLRLFALQAMLPSVTLTSSEVQAFTTVFGAAGAGMIWQSSSTGCTAVSYSSQLCATAL